MFRCSMLRCPGERVHAAGVLVCDELHYLAGVGVGTVVVDPSAHYLGDCGAPQSRAEVVKFGRAVGVGVIGQLMTAASTARILEEVAREGQGAG